MYKVFQYGQHYQILHGNLLDMYIPNHSLVHSNGV